MVSNCKEGGLCEYWEEVPGYTRYQPVTQTGLLKVFKQKLDEHYQDAYYVMHCTEQRVGLDDSMVPYNSMILQLATGN